MQIEDAINLGRLNNPQQHAVYSAVSDYNSGHKKLLIDMATSMGKTRTGQAVALVIGNGPILWVSHEDTILNQAVGSWKSVYEVECAKFVPGSDKVWDGKTTFYCSVQSLYVNRHKLRSGLFGTIIVDEAHHTECMMYQTILSILDPEFLLGLTATKDRTDGYSLLGTFKKVSYEYPLVLGVREGYLSKIRVERIVTGIDISGVKLHHDGDYKQFTLGRRVAIPSRNDLIVDAYLRHNRKAMCFCVSVPHLRMMEEAFNQRGVSVIGVHGYLSKAERGSRIAAYRDGTRKVLCVVDLCKESFDDPATDMLLMARPTKSMLMYLQMLGRGVRKFEGKDYLLLADFVDVTKTHDLGVQQTAHRLFDLKSYVPKVPVDILDDANGQVDLSKYKVIKFEKYSLITKDTVGEYGNYPSEEQIHAKARELFKEHGRFTESIWDAASGFQTWDLISRHYRESGFSMTIGDVRNRLELNLGAATKENILKRAKELHAAHGELTEEIWNLESGFPKLTTIWSNFKRTTGNGYGLADIKAELGIPVERFGRRGRPKTAVEASKAMALSVEEKVRNLYEAGGLELVKKKRSLMRAIGGVGGLKKFLNIDFESDAEFAVRARNTIHSEVDKLGRKLTILEIVKLLSFKRRTSCRSKIIRLIPDVVKSCVAVRERNYSRDPNRKAILTSRVVTTVPPDGNSDKTVNSVSEAVGSMLKGVQGDIIVEIRIHKQVGVPRPATAPRSQSLINSKRYRSQSGFEISAESLRTTEITALMRRLAAEVSQAKGARGSGTGKAGRELYNKLGIEAPGHGEHYLFKYAAAVNGIEPWCSEYPGIKTELESIRAA